MIYDIQWNNLKVNNNNNWGKKKHIENFATYLLVLFQKIQRFIKVKWLRGKNFCSLRSDIKYMFVKTY